MYFGKDGQTVTGRTMDCLHRDIDTNLRLYPRGLERTSGTKNPFTWKTKFASVVTTIYEGAAADGRNEKAVEANLLHLAESVADLRKEAFRMVTIRSRWRCRRPGRRGCRALPRLSGKPGQNMRGKR